MNQTRDACLTEEFVLYITCYLSKMNFVKYGIFSIVGIAGVVLLSIVIEYGIESIDSMLVPCQHGTTYVNNKCSCLGTPFDGKYCDNCICDRGYCVLGEGTTKSTSDYGCKCLTGTKIWGRLCDMCNTVDNATDCKGNCTSPFYGSMCNKVCFEEVNYWDSTRLDATGDEKTCGDIRRAGGSCSACNGHGSCGGSGCVCDEHWYDDGPNECSLTCPSINGTMCNGHGSCVLFGNKPGCLCAFGWRGESCDIPCPGVLETGKGCYGHGICNVDFDTREATCDCNQKYRGDSCQYECPGEIVACSGHGICNDVGVCSCESLYEGPSCNCSGPISCSNRGVCNNGICKCDGNFGGSFCQKCKDNFWGTECNFFCDPSGPFIEKNRIGCNDNGRCTVVNQGTINEEIACTCNVNEKTVYNDGAINVYRSQYSVNDYCAACEPGYFPSIEIFEEHSSSLVSKGIHVECQVFCTGATCNNIGACNPDYGIPGELLCSCPDNVNDESFCTACDDNWYPATMQLPSACTKYCLAETSCNGNGVCNEDGNCVCNEGYTGTECEINCQSEDGTECGGHGKCVTTMLQLVLEHELEPGTRYSCECDPQDDYSEEERLEDDELSDPPKKEYFGEKCESYCVLPPWKDAEPCNGLGECTVYPIQDADGSVVTCNDDNACKDSETVQAITSGDSRWNERKGPFCQKPDKPLPTCTEYTEHDCLRIMTLQRPTMARSKACMDSTECKNKLNDYDWHNWCLAVNASDEVAGFESCDDVVSTFCPVQTIPEYCLEYVEKTSGDMSNHLNYCYEKDHSYYPFDITINYRWSQGTVKHDDIAEEFMEFSLANNVKFNSKDYCKMFLDTKKLYVTEIGQNKRYSCNNVITSSCSLNQVVDLGDEWRPWTVSCFDSERQYSELIDAINARKEGCYIYENAPRDSTLSNQALGADCTLDSECLSGVCQNTCCKEFTSNCAKCSNTGDCVECIAGSTWNGEECEGQLDVLNSELETGDVCSEDSCKSQLGCMAYCNKNSYLFSSYNTECKCSNTKTTLSGGSGIYKLCQGQWVDNVGCTKQANGAECSIDDHCLHSCIGGFCCDKTNCKTCNSGGECVQCLDGASGENCDIIDCNSQWIENEGCSEPIENIKEALTLVDASCKVMETRFPTCPPPQSACDINACLEGDTCTPRGKDAICETTGVLNCTCAHGLTCERLSFSSYKCIGEFEESNCHEAEAKFNWLEYCRDNNPVQYYENFGEFGINEGDQNIQGVFKDIQPEYVDFWVKSSDFFGTSAALEVSNYNDNIFRVFLHKGQIQMNEVETLEACPLDNPTCHDTWSFEADQWYHLGVSIDWSNKKVSLHKDEYVKTRDFINDANTVNMFKIIQQGATTYYDEIVFEAPLSIPPSLAQCSNFAYCDFNVNYRQICSDVVRFAQYPLTLTPKHDILDICAKHFPTRLFEGAEATLIQKNAMESLDWYTYCSFAEEIDANYDCQNMTYQYLSNFSNCENYMLNTKQCTVDALNHDWNVECENVKEKFIPQDIQDVCSEECYYDFVSYENCTDRFELYETSTKLKNSECDWIDFCFKLAGNKLDGVCSAVECDCNAEYNLGVSGESCQMVCPISSDGSACAEKSGLGECVYTESQRKVIHKAKRENSYVDGHLVAYQTQIDSLHGVCECYGSEGHNCDMECRACQNYTYDTFNINGKPYDAYNAICDTSRGLCQCLAPYVTMREISVTDWRGKVHTVVRRAYGLPDNADMDTEYRIRLMQGRESFVRTYLDKTTSHSNWTIVYNNFRSNPELFTCKGEACSEHDFIMLGNYEHTSSSFNFDCNKTCPGTNEHRIPCSGHGRCGIDGQCVCDYAKKYKATDPLTGQSFDVHVGQVEMETSELIISKLDKSGWRGDNCSVMCPGYDPETESMLNVCGGHGICNEDAQCQCDLGYTGDNCQFLCPGFQEGDKNVCSGHGTCLLNEIDIVKKRLRRTPVCHGTWGAWSDCDGTYRIREFNGYNCRREPEIQDCRHEAVGCDGYWSEWSVCSHGHHYRNFTITRQPKNGGIHCPPLTQRKKCVNSCGPLHKEDCSGCVENAYDIGFGCQCKLGYREHENKCKHSLGVIAELYAEVSVSTKWDKACAKVIDETKIYQLCETQTIENEITNLRHSEIVECMEFCYRYPNVDTWRIDLFYMDNDFITENNICDENDQTLHKVADCTCLEGWQTPTDCEGSTDTEVVYKSRHGRFLTNIYHSLERTENTIGLTCNVDKNCGEPSVCKSRCCAEDRPTCAECDEEGKCSKCIDGMIYFAIRDECIPLPCEGGKVWNKDLLRCVVFSGEEDAIFQTAIEEALEQAKCGENKYKDIKSNNCTEITDEYKPFIEITLYFDRNTTEEVSSSFGCEVWSSETVRCPECSCFTDKMYGKWSSFECETCQKGYGKKQCRNACPGYDDVDETTMCNGHGMCSFGSIFNETTDQRSFYPALCTCGNPPGSITKVNPDLPLGPANPPETMIQYGMAYREFVTISEPFKELECTITNRVDNCYHFNELDAGCSTCEESYSGENCRYQCDKCLNKGSCNEVPTNDISAACNCPAVFGVSGLLWNLNCCPIGFIIADIETFNKKRQYQIDEIAINADYTKTPGFDMATDIGVASDYCEPCPGVYKETQWLNSNAQFTVCGGVYRGRCTRDTTTKEPICACDVENNGGFSGPFCRCKANLEKDFINIHSDYGCYGRGECADKEELINDVKMFSNSTKCSGNGNNIIAINNFGNVEYSERVQLCHDECVGRGDCSYYSVLTDDPAITNEKQCLLTIGLECCFVNNGVLDCFKASTNTARRQSFDALTCANNRGAFQANHLPQTCNPIDDIYYNLYKLEKIEKQGIYCTSSSGNYISLEDNVDEEGVAGVKQEVKPADAGHYVPDDGKSHVEQINCPRGQYQPYAEQKNCTDAPKGSYVDEKASSFYKPCPFAQYQDEEGQIDCKTCPDGTESYLDDECELIQEFQESSLYSDNTKLCTNKVIDNFGDIVWNHLIQSNNYYNQVVIYPYEKYDSSSDFPTFSSCAEKCEGFRTFELRPLTSMGWEYCVCSNRDIQTTASYRGQTMPVRDWSSWNNKYTCPARATSGAVYLIDECKNFMERTSSNAYQYDLKTILADARYYIEMDRIWQSPIQSTQTTIKSWKGYSGTYYNPGTVKSCIFLTDKCEDNDNLANINSYTRGGAYKIIQIRNSFDVQIEKLKCKADKRKSCRPCPVGKYNSDGSDGVCDVCLHGQYQDEEGQSSCKQCPAGTYLIDNATEVSAHDHVDDCTKCAAGKYSTSLGAIAESTCIDCPLGKFGPLDGGVSEEAACTGRCSAGKYGSTAGQSTEDDGCTDCAMGTYQNTQGSDSCNLCDHGTYTDQEGSTECKKCQAGKTTPRFEWGQFDKTSRQISEEKCKEAREWLINNDNSRDWSGFKNIDIFDGFVREDNIAVTSDGSGKYCEFLDWNICILDNCNEHIGFRHRTTKCVESSSSHLTTLCITEGTRVGCVDCAAGKYADAEASASCKDCPLGKFGTLEGQTEEDSCTGCSAGRYGTTAGQSSDASACTNCPQGKYQDTTGSTTCKGCVAGKYSASSGAIAESTCKACSQGYYQPNAFSTSCIECPGEKVGTAQTGSTSQSQCRSCQYQKNAGNCVGDGCCGYGINIWTYSISGSYRGPKCPASYPVNYECFTGKSCGYWYSSRCGLGHCPSSDPCPWEYESGAASGQCGGSDTDRDADGRRDCNGLDTRSRCNLKCWCRNCGTTYNPCGGRSDFISACN